MEFGRTIVQLFPKCAHFRNRGRAFVDVLNDPTFRPTVFGGDPPERVFEPEDLEQAAEQFSADPEDPLPSFGSCFERKKNPKWSGFADVWCSEFCFDGSLAQSELPRLFEWSDRLADVVHPEFGACHRILLFDEVLHNNWSVGISRTTFQEMGPAWLGVRTYLGRTLIERIGSSTLRSSGLGSIVERDWGFIVDLVENPWLAAPEEIVTRQEAVMAELLKTGLFGIYGEDSEDKAPGPNWEPIVEAI